MTTDAYDQEVDPVDDQAQDSTGGVRTDLVGGGRRRLLFGGMAAALGVIVTACSGDDDSSSATSAAGGSTSAASGSTTVMDTAEDDGASTSPNETNTTGTGTTDTQTTAAEGDEPTSDGKNQEADVTVREGDIDGGRDPNNPTAEEPSAELSRDLATVEFAAGLEVLAVNTYHRASLAASAGDLGAVPPAVGEFVVTVMGHHQAVLDELNRVLLLFGEPAVTASDSTLQPVVDDTFAAVTDVPGAARLALMLEEIAAATYLSAIPELTSPEAIALAAAVYPIDMQHASVLRFVLGEYPVPDTFGTVDKAASTS